MKHIISLAFKYIRRQKMRTVLTFLCVTLSVFILCSFGAYISSTLQTLRNQAILEEGYWEADISNWVEESENKPETFDIIKNHVAVDDYYSMLNGLVRGETSRLENDDGRITYFQLTDGKNTHNFSTIYETSIQGNISLNGQNYDMMYTVPEDEGVSVPEWFKDMGYSIGDTVNFRIRRVDAEIDEDSKEVKEVRERLMEEYGCPYVVDDEEWREYNNNGDENHSESYGSLMFYALQEYSDLNDNCIKNAEYGEYFDYSLKIAKFNNGSELDISINGGDDYFFSDFMEKNEDLVYMKAVHSIIRVNENIDFDDGLIMLYKDLGYDEGSYYINVPELNDELLFYEFRSASGIVAMFPLIIVILVMIFFAWLVARFVIDNTFEISNQERSAQFAALRVMGASKRQIVTLIFTEGIFYTFTSVPIGAFFAYAFCKSSFNAINNLGFSVFEYNSNIYFLMGSIILCVAAIFISAYTSALWASRKLSPAEALNFGKPVSNKKLRKRKSKIKLTSAQFLRRYTNKNIMRNKSRYIISTITLAFGVMFFTFSAMVGIFAYNIIDENRLQLDDSPDFYMYCYDLENIENARNTFCNNDLFRNVEIKARANSRMDRSKTDTESFAENNINLFSYISIATIDRENYDKYIYNTSGMTYDEFVDSGCAIFNTSIYRGADGTGEYDENGNLKKMRDEFCTHFENPLEIAFVDKKVMKVSDFVCSGYREYTNGLIIPLDSEMIMENNLELDIEFSVNGQKNYKEAKEIFEKFKNEHNILVSGDQYAVFTGRSEFIKAIVKIAITFVGSIWLVGILSMINSINTSVLNRSRELMMLRSVGMSMKQLKKTVIMESMMFSSVASSVGTILAILAFFILVKLLEANPEILVTTAIGLILSLIVNIAISGLAAIPGIRSLEKAESLVRQNN